MAEDLNLNSDRYEYTKDELKQMINEAMTDFRTLAESMRLQKCEQNS